MTRGTRDSPLSLHFRSRFSFLLFSKPIPFAKTRHPPSPRKLSEISVRDHTCPRLLYLINLKFETRLRFLLIEGEYIYFISSRISLLIWSIWARKIVATICLPTRCFFSLCTISHKNCRRERKPAG